LKSNDIYSYILDNKIPEKHWWFRVRNNLIYIVLKRILKFEEGENRNIFDVGSGYGQLFQIWQKFGHIYSIDNNKYFTSYQKQHYKRAVIWNSDFPNKESFKYKYDLICMCDFLEHIKEPDQILESSYELLREKGSLLITVPVYKWMWADFDVVSGHIRRYSRNQLISEVENFGFKCTYSTYFITLLFPLAVITRKIINPIRKRNKNFLGLEFGYTGKFLNEILYHISNLETKLIGKRMAMPFGLSILGIFQKNNN